LRRRRSKKKPRLMKRLKRQQLIQRLRKLLLLRKERVKKQTNLYWMSLNWKYQNWWNSTQ
jgi:hypothetical protein